MTTTTTAAAATVAATARRRAATANNGNIYQLLGASALALVIYLTRGFREKVLVVALALFFYTRFYITTSVAPSSVELDSEQTKSARERALLAKRTNPVIIRGAPEKDI